MNDSVQVKYRGLDGDSRFALIDRERGTLRLLVTLLKYGQGLVRQQLIEKLREQGVGRTSLYSSLEVCIELGLIVDVNMMRGSHFCTVSMLTEFGYQLALVLSRLMKMLDGDDV
jgi:hypothetical protein